MELATWIFLIWKGKYWCFSTKYTFSNFLSKYMQEQLKTCTPSEDAKLYTSRCGKFQPYLYLSNLSEQERHILRQTDNNSRHLGGAANQTRGQELHPHHQHYSLPPRYDFSGARWLFQQGSSGRVHCELYIYWTWHWAPCTAWALQKEQNISRDGHTHLPLSKRSHAYKDTQSCSQIHCKICQILIDLVHAQQCQVKITGSTLGKKRRI